MGPVLFSKGLLRIHADEAAGLIFENRSAVDFWVHEHRKQRKSHQMSIRVKRSKGLFTLKTAATQAVLSSPAMNGGLVA